MLKDLIKASLGANILKHGIDMILACSDSTS